MRFNRRLAAVLTITLAGMLSSAASAQVNVIYDELIGKGIALPNGQVVQLPQPTMADGLNAAAQDAVMKKLERPPRPKDFVKGEISGPFTLEINDVKAPNAKAGNQGIGRRVDLYFVAKGKLAWVANKKFINQVLDGGNGQAKFFTDAELKDRKLIIIDNEQLRERYAHASLDLFGMVQVSGSGRGIQTNGPDSVLVAFRLEPKFEKDRQYPNQWQPIRKGAAGNALLGAPQPYSGLGGYMKVTELKEAPDRVFVEYHLVFDEPHGWWQGRAVLRSKLPNQYENDVRKFRRDLTAFGASPDAAAEPTGAAAPAAGAPAVVNQPSKTSEPAKPEAKSAAKGKKG